MADSADSAFPSGYIPPPPPGAIFPPPLPPLPPGGPAGGWVTYPTPQQYPQQFPQPAGYTAERLVTDDQGRVFPTLGISLLMIGIYFVLQIVCTIFVVGVSSLFDPELRKSLTSGTSTGVSDTFQDGSGAVFLGGLVLAGTIMTIGMMLHLRDHGRLRVIGWNTPNRISIGETIGLSVALLIVNGILTAIYTKALDGRELQKETSDMIKAIDRTPLNLMLIFGSIAIVAPVVEELLFRGYLQNALARKMKPGFAIAIASAVFGAIHLQPLAFPVLTLLGAIFGFLYHRTGSLKVTMTLHLINNTFAGLMILFASGT
jgi:membrane protease YdiL (CAAX protease family)